MKFTPGPWTYAHTGYGGFYIETPNNEQIRVAVVYHETNARLIAAAPDLYEALQELLMHASFPPQEMQSGEDPFPAHAAIINARAVLAKVNE